MKVRQVLRVDAGLYYGGGEVQAERTRGALADLGVDVHVQSPTDRDLGDLVHFYGLFDSHWEIAEHCRERGVPYVVSPIFGTPRSRPRLRWRSFRQRYLDFRFPKKQWKLLKHAAEIFPLTNFEKANLQTYFPGLNDSRFFTIPNGVETRFASGNPELFRTHFGISDPFVLHAAAVDRNKNQLMLIRALAKTDIQVVFMGRIDVPHYWRECEAVMTPNMRHIGTIPHDSDLLPAAYAAAAVFCLPSRREILPLSAMEATAAGCRLVLSTGWGGEEIWGDRAEFVDPTNPESIRGAVQRALAKQRNDADAEQFLEQHRWSAVAGSLKDRYERVLGKHK